MELNKQFNYFIILPSLSFLGLIILSLNYEVEEIIEGKGKVVTNQKNQEISNLEGGIIEKIYVKENQVVKKGQQLLKIKNLVFHSKQAEYKKLKEINQIKMKRLEAELNKKDLIYSKKDKEILPIITKLENNIYNQRKREIEIEIEQINLKIKQKELEIKKTEKNLINKKLERETIKRDFEITKNLYDNKNIPKKEFLEEKLKRKTIESEIEKIKNETPILIEERKEQEINKDLMINEKDIEIIKELIRIKKDNLKVEEKMKELQDKIDRQYVISPIQGIIKKINNTTITGIIKKGDNILSISPNVEDIIIETEILNRDRGDIKVGQKVKIDFNAYPYGEYGFLEGEIISISPDSFMKKSTEELLYIIKVKSKEKQIKGNKILNGMTANVNIIGGKKTIMEYIIKPIKNIKNSKINGEKNE